MSFFFLRGWHVSTDTQVENPEIAQIETYYNILDVLFSITCDICFRRWRHKLAVFYTVELCVNNGVQAQKAVV